MRPIPRNLVPASEALALGLFLSGASVFCLGVLVNWVAAGLLALTIAHYMVVYTMWLKRRTPQNIVIGGAAGAFPPMIGWAAATGSISLDSIILFAIIFFWTPAHFWALALVRSRDYKRAGVPMLPVVAGKKTTRTQIMIYAVLTAFCGIAPVITGLSGMLYLAVSVTTGALFVGFATVIYARGDGPGADKAARRLFNYSLLYLFILFATLLAEHALRLV
jgi:protoheme IX farnesyltransferase